MEPSHCNHSISGFVLKSFHDAVPAKLPVSSRPC